MVLWGPRLSGSRSRPGVRTGPACCECTLERHRRLWRLPQPGRPSYRPSGLTRASSYYTSARGGPDRRRALRGARVPAVVPCSFSHPIRRRTPTASHPMCHMRPAKQPVPRRCPASPVRSRGASFLICQPHVRQHVADRRQAAPQPGGRPQLRQCQIRPFGQQGPELGPMRRRDHRLASRTVMQRPDLSQAPPLLQQFLDHPQRHAEPSRHLCPRPSGLVVTAQNTFPHVQANGLHEPTLYYKRGSCGYTIS